MYSYSSGQAYDDMIREMRMQIRDLSREIRGEISAAMYIGKSDRLMRLELDMDLEIYGERGRVNITFDFGSSAKDLWVFEVSMPGSSGEKYILEWELKETSRGGETSLRFIEEYRGGRDTSEILLNWTERGSFNIAFIEDRNRETLLSGTYTREKDGFKMVIDNLLLFTYGSDSIELEISTASGKGIPKIDYINISEWNMSLIDKIEDFVYDFGFGGGYDEPYYAEPPGYSYSGESGGADISGYALAGAWEFSHGDGTYFFWSSSYVEFTLDGWVYNGNDSYGTWTLDGNRLTVTDEYDDIYYFTIEVWDSMISITDHDHDTGYFIRLW